MQSGLRQGDVFWADLGEPAGVRPVVLLTRSSALRRLSGVTVAPVTRTIRGIETEVLLELPTSRGRGAITLDNILTIQKSMLREFICSLEEPTMHDVFGAVHAAFDMPF